MLPDFSSVRALVVGDLMLDRYHHGAVSRISPEAPVQVVQVERSEDQPGGAAHVAVNVANLGATAHLLGFVGADEEADTLHKLTQKRGVRSHFIDEAGSRTSIKTRVISRNQQLLRLDFETSSHRYRLDELSRRFAELLPQVNVVILSDYAKGCLLEAQTLIELARSQGLAVFVDPKQADFSVYRGATALTPNWREFLSAAGLTEKSENLWREAESFCRRLSLGALLITHGGHGMHLLEDRRAMLNFPARAREVYDVTGAGDTVIAVTACAYSANGADLPAAVHLANQAAGLAVEKLGTAPIELSELSRVAAPPSRMPGVHSEKELMNLLAQARKNGERVVMTNGCFDLLHAGHVHCLRQAAELGDRLIVAVNDDASVRSLKGAGRPLNTLSHRLQLLSALDMVDWLIPFSGPDPEDLIASLLPDVLVKGGDYKPEDIAGYRAVIDNGGQVKTLAYQEGLSSGSLARRMRALEDGSL